MVGNTTLLIGTEDEKIDEIKTILKKYCSTRKQINPSADSFGQGLRTLGEETVVNGATIFVLNVESYDKL